MFQIVTIIQFFLWITSCCALNDDNNNVDVVVADGDDVDGDVDYLLENMQMGTERSNSVNHRIEWVVYSTSPVMNDPSDPGRSFFSSSSFEIVKWGKKLNLHFLESYLTTADVHNTNIHITGEINK